MTRRAWIAIVAIALMFVLIAALSVFYSGAVSLVSDEIEGAKARIERRDDGSIMEWSGYEIDGISVEMTNFHYYDADEDYDIFAERMKVTKRVGENYSGQFEGLTIEMGENDIYTVETGSLTNFNGAEDIEDFTSENTIFNGFSWKVNDRNPFALSIDKIEFQDFERLKTEALLIENLRANYEELDLLVTAPSARIDNMLMLSRDKYFRLDGILYTDFVIENLQGVWHEKPVFEGGLDSHGAYDKKTRIIENADTRFWFDYDVSSDLINQYGFTGDNPNERLRDLIKELDQEQYQGQFALDLNIEDGQDALLNMQLDMTNLGAFTFKSQFGGYTTDFMQDIDQFQKDAPIPRSFDEFELIGAELIYRDEILADYFLSEYVRVDPAVASFLVQVVFPQFLPKDPELVRESAKALSSFLSQRNMLGAAMHPDSPVSLSEVIRTIEENGPYKERLGVIVVGE